MQSFSREYACVWCIAQVVEANIFDRVVRVGKSYANSLISAAEVCGSEHTLFFSIFLLDYIISMFYKSQHQCKLTLLSLVPC